jgi:hypothetical protein
LPKANNGINRNHSEVSHRNLPKANRNHSEFYPLKLSTAQTTELVVKFTAGNCPNANHIEQSEPYPLKCASIESKTPHCKPKINELAVKALGPGSVKEHDVLRLHVPAGDAVEMQMFHST